MIKRFFSISKKFDVAVIGAGPGGYVAAIKAAQLGLTTACIESRGSLGGTCLNVGCIPSKTLLQISHKYHDLQTLDQYGLSCEKPEIHWDKVQKQKKKVVDGLTGGIEYLFKKNGVEYVKGHGTLNGKKEISVKGNDGEQILQADNIILATGSEPMELPGFKFDEEKIVSSTGALALKEIPKKMIIIGAGVIGLELGSVYRRLGSQITVLEYLDRIAPFLDQEIGKNFERFLKKEKFKFKFQQKCVKGEVLENGKVRVTHEDLKTNKTNTEEADVVLLSTGRKPYTQNLGLEKLGIETDKIGRIKINDQFQTSVPNIYAIGDCVEGPMLAHKAEEEGVAVAEYLAGRDIHLNYSAIPGVIYTHPEIAWVGYTEQNLKDQKIDYKVGSFPLSANSRNRANVENSPGLVKILADKKTDRILGAHIMAPQAGDLIQELVLAIEYGATCEDVARTCHAHPSLSEALKEATLSAYFKPIHA